MKPRDAKTFDQICKLKRDNVSAIKSWMSINPDYIHICEQRNGEPATASVSISRKAFEKFVDFYNKDQK